MKGKETRIRIVLDNGTEETLIGVGNLNREPHWYKVPVGLSAGLETILAALQLQPINTEIVA